MIMTAHSDLSSAINSYQTGAFEYLPKPFDLDEAVATIYKAINYQPNLKITNDATKPAQKTVKKAKPPNLNLNLNLKTQQVAISITIRAVSSVNHKRCKRYFARLDAWHTLLLPF